MFNYSVTVQKTETGDYWATCKAVPEFNSVGETQAQALADSIDGLVAALSFYIDRKVAFPKVLPQQAGEHIVTLPFLVVAKMALWQSMCEQGWKKADLVRALHVHPPQVDRLLDLCHSSKPELLEKAMFALGKQLTINVESRAA